MADTSTNQNAALQTQGLNDTSTTSAVNESIANQSNNPGALDTSGSAVIAPPIVPTTISSANLSPATPIQLPTPNNASNASSLNSSVASPIPSAQSIIEKASAPTAADAAQKAILDRIASLTGSNATQTGLTNTAEENAGIPSLTSTVNDLNTQLEGLNNQATDLQNKAAFTIPNAAQAGAAGRGETAGGLSPVTTAQLRNNQIQQGAIASQALTLKSAIYGAQGKLSIAKDAADKAATAQFEQQQQQIDAQRAQLAAIAPTLTKQESVQAAKQKAALDDRQTQLDNAKSDKSTIVALATAALKNNPNDPQAQYAAQQALALSNQDKPDLAGALALVGKYQTDPVATQKAVLDNQLLKSQITKAQYDAATAKLNFDNTNSLGGNLPGTTESGKIDVTSQNYATSAVTNAGGLSQSSIDQAALRYLMDGTLPAGRSNTGNGLLQNSAIKNRAGQLDPGGNIAGNKAKVEALASALKEQTSYSATIDRSVTTADNSFKQITQAFSGKDVNTHTMPIANLIENATKMEFSPGDVAAFKAGLSSVATEYQQVFAKNGTATVADKAKAEQIANGNLSLADLQKVMDQLQAQGDIAKQGAQGEVDKVYGQIAGVESGAFATQKGNLSDGDFVNQALSSQNISYNQAKSAVPAGQIGAIDNSTGQLVQMLPSDFDPAKYTKI